MRDTARKRRLIVAAATELFTRDGFKHTSVDRIAAGARVAKPTIYAYFADKDAIFAAVVDAVCAELLEAANAASRSSGSIEARLAKVLAAKFTRYWELVESSPHAAELVDSQNTLGAKAVEQLDRAYLAIVVAMIGEADGAGELDLARAGLTSTTAAQLLVRAASGAAYDATSTATHRKYVASIVRAIVAGLRA